MSLNHLNKNNYHHQTESKAVSQTTTSLLVFLCTSNRCTKAREWGVHIFLGSLISRCRDLQGSNLSGYRARLNEQKITYQKGRGQMTQLTDWEETRGFWVDTGNLVLSHLPTDYYGLYSRAITMSRAYQVSWKFQF